MKIINIDIPFYEGYVINLYLKDKKIRISFKDRGMYSIGELVPTLHNILIDLEAKYLLKPSEIKDIQFLNSDGDVIFKFKDFGVFLEFVGGVRILTLSDTNILETQKQMLESDAFKEHVTIIDKQRKSPHTVVLTDIKNNEI